MILDLGFFLVGKRDKKRKLKKIREKEKKKRKVKKKRIWKKNLKKRRKKEKYNKKKPLSQAPIRPRIEATAEQDQCSWLTITGVKGVCVVIKCWTFQHPELCYVCGFTCIIYTAVQMLF